MAYYRRYRKSYRRRTYGRKRTWRKSFKSQSIRYNRRRQPIHQFTKFVNKGKITGSNGSSFTAGELTFKLPDVSNWATDYQGAYDQFRIKAVKVSFIPVSNVTSFDSNKDGPDRTTYYSRIFSVFDPNSKGAPGSTNELREYHTAKWSPNNVIHKRFIYPKVRTAVNEGSGTYGTMHTKGSPWINMDSNSCEYFAIKYAIDHPQLAANHDLYAIECKYYLQFRYPK